MLTDAGLYSIIATPGRLLHLVVEMNLDLRSVEYIVFDEADRYVCLPFSNVTTFFFWSIAYSVPFRLNSLFEMGFEIQLQEILYRLPATRQTLLYSATLPKNLVEFAKAGLSNPRLIRLDAEAKISNDLQMSFFSVKPAEKEAALMSLLREVIGVPLKDPDEVVSEEEADPDDEERPRFGGGKGDYRGKGKGKPVYKKREKLPTQMAPHQTLVFAATKHHVDYLSNLLITAGYAVSHIYGSLDQTARKQQLDRFRRGRTSILVVTDVAARGIDIPVLENVINYDFPTGSRVFVHRVGRTARAGRKGAAWSFVTNTELPFFLDLQLFLGRSLVNSRTAALPSFDPASAIYLGTIPRDSIDADFEYIQTSLSESNPHLPILKAVVKKGQAMYERSQGKASQESYRRAKEMTKDPTWGLAGSIGEEAAVHPSFSASVSGHINPSNQTIFAATPTTSAVVKAQDPSIVAAARATLLASVNSFRPSETIFEIGNRGKNASFKLMQDRRNTLAKAVGRRNPELAAPTSVVPGADKAGEKNWDDEEGEMDANTEAGLRKRNGMDLEMADEDELEVC
jgi:ATP-dependent RNA helicase DDX54/DBP10